MEPKELQKILIFCIVLLIFNLFILFFHVLSAFTDHSESFREFIKREKASILTNFSKDAESVADRSNSVQKKLKGIISELYDENAIQSRFTSQIEGSIKLIIQKVGQVKEKIHQLNTEINNLTKNPKEK